MFILVICAIPYAVFDDIWIAWYTEDEEVVKTAKKLALLVALWLCLMAVSLSLQAGIRGVGKQTAGAILAVIFEVFIGLSVNIFLAFVL